MLPAVAFSSTTLQDLPLEVLDYILMKAVVKKVMDMKRAKSSWINCASEVMKPLRSVWSLWDFRMTTNWFEIVLHRTLNSKHPTPITVTQITESQCSPTCRGFGLANNQIYCIDTEFPHTEEDDEFLSDSTLHVFESRDMTNCIRKIPLPSVHSIRGMAFCKQSNRVFLWHDDTWFALQPSPTVRCLVPDKDGSFEVRCWPTYVPPDGCFEKSNINELGVVSLSVVDDGNVLVLREVFYEGGRFNNIISIHAPDGAVILDVLLLNCNILSNIVMKSNGNLVFVENIRDGSDQFFIREVDQSGCDITRFEWSHDCDCGFHPHRLFLDEDDRVIVHVCCKKLLFLDSKLCFLEEIEVCGVKPGFNLCQSAFNKATNELVSWYEQPLPQHDFHFYKITI